MEVLLVLEVEVVLVSQVEVLLVLQMEVLLVSQVEVLLILEMGSQVEVLLVFAMVLLLTRHAAPPSASTRTLPAKTSESAAEICHCYCGGCQIPAQICDG